MTQEMAAGSNVSLAALAPGQGTIQVEITWAPEQIGGLDVDASAFLLAADGKARSDADFVFYNQPRSADGSVETSAPAGGKQRFKVDLGRVPAEIDKVAFVVTINEAAARGVRFEQASAVDLNLLDASSSPVARFDAGPAGRKEAALILGELYRRNDDWKFRAVGQGFGGGLGPLATSFGINIGADEPAVAPPPPPAAAPSPAPSPAPAAAPTAAASPTAAPAPAPPAPPAQASDGKVRLEKKLVDLEKKDPQLVSLVKKVQVSLDKQNLATDRAKVALCLDISGSMSGLYRGGQIDHLVQRIMALGYRFDDDGEIDVFLFGSSAHEYGTLDVNSYRTFVDDMQRQYGLEAGTNYGKVMRLIRSHYQRDRDFGSLPVYVMFVTDGDTQDRDGTERELRDASREPIFWKFMAIGEKRGGFLGRLTGNFEFLEKLDDLGGRAVDNADFFLVKDPQEPTDEALFDLLMNEYAAWMTAARSQNILRL